MLTREQIAAVIVAGTSHLLAGSVSVARHQAAADDIADALLSEFQPADDQADEDWRIGMLVVLRDRDRDAAIIPTGRVQQRKVTDGELHTLMVAWPGQSALSPHSPAELEPAP